MRTKYLIWVDTEKVFGTFYDPKSRAVIVGGPRALISNMKTFITEYLGKEYAPYFMNITNSKVRASLRCGRNKFMEAVEKIRGEGYTVDDVKTFGGLMR